jgi:hypothetical protein
MNKRRNFAKTLTPFVEVFVSAKGQKSVYVPTLVPTIILKLTLKKATLVEISDSTRVDTKFRNENYFCILQNFYFISRNLSKILQPCFAKFQEIKVKIMRNKIIFH